MDTRTALALPSSGHADAIIDGIVFRGRLDANVVRDALHAVITRNPAFGGRVRRDAASPTGYVLAVPKAFTAQEPAFLETYSASLAKLLDVYPLALPSKDITLVRRPTFAERAAVFSPSPHAPVKLSDYLNIVPPTGGRTSTPILYLHVGQYSDGFSVVGLRVSHAALDGSASGALKRAWSMAMRDPAAYAEETSNLVQAERPSGIVDPFACFSQENVEVDAGARIYSVSEGEDRARFREAMTCRRVGSDWAHNRLVVPSRAVKLLTDACNMIVRSTFGSDAFLSSSDVVCALIWQGAVHRRKDPKVPTVLLQMLDVRSRCADLRAHAFGNLAAHAYAPSPLLAVPSPSPPSSGSVSSASLPTLARMIRLSLGAWTPSTCRSATRWRLDTARLHRREKVSIGPDVDPVSVTNRSKLGQLSIGPGPAWLSGPGECTHRFAVGEERFLETDCFTIQESTDGLHFEVEGVARPESWDWMFRFLSQVDGPGHQQESDEPGKGFIVARL